MTTRARLVLEDARAAATELPDYESGPHDEPTIRRRLVAVMALLRAVGNVLQDVDSKRSNALRRAVEEKWQELKQQKPVIFTEFIEGYRAAVLKRYEQPEIDFDKIMGTLYPRLLVQHGGAVGVSVNHLVEEAIRFWEQYLNDVDQLAAIYKREAQK